eukprot:COSAG02_NODE_7848_length_2820_cov_3.458287_6_plen_136_part_00
MHAIALCNSNLRPSLLWEPILTSQLRLLCSQPNIPAVPSLNFQELADETTPKRLLSPAFATHSSRAASAENLPDKDTTSRHGSSPSIPSSPGILFGSFDQWEAAASKPVADADANPVPAVEAREDVRYVTETPAR